MNDTLTPSTFCVVLYGEGNDVPGTLKTLKNVFDIVSEMGARSKPLKSKRRLLAAKRDAETPMGKLVLTERIVNNVNVKVFIKNTNVNALYARQMSDCFSKRIQDEMKEHVATIVSKTATRRKGVSKFAFDVYSLEEPKLKHLAKTRATLNWWTHQCVGIWSTLDKSPSNVDCKQFESKSVVDQFRNLGDITVLDDVNNDDDEDAPKFDHCPVIHCKSNSVFSLVDFRRMLTHAALDDRIQTFDLKQCVKLDKDDDKRDENDVEESTEDKKDEDFSDVTEASMPTWSFVRNVRNAARYFPYLLYAMLSFVALMCDYVEPDDHKVKSYLLKFKRKKSKKENKDDTCIVCAFASRTGPRGKKGAKITTKHHGHLRTSGTIYEYGTFFGDRMEKLCTNWNGSVFAVFYLAFDYVVAYRCIEYFRNGAFVESIEYVNYAWIVMALFYYAQVHYCYHFLVTIQLIRRGVAVSFFKKTFLIIVISIVYPFLFVFFYPPMWIFRRFLSKRGWFSNARCSRSIRNWLFSSSSAPKGAARSRRNDKKTFDSKRNSSLWNFCCCCCPIEDDDDDVVVASRASSASHRFGNVKYRHRNVDDDVDSESSGEIDDSGEIEQIS